uniref:Uncharacterized protein n=1 Tax=Arion vulgaris TaxID=1028688 RepID=A0A0B7BJW6_9EUPU
MGNNYYQGETIITVQPYYIIINSSLSHSDFNICMCTNSSFFNVLCLFNELLCFEISPEIKNLPGSQSKKAQHGKHTEVHNT